MVKSNPKTILKPHSVDIKGTFFVLPKLTQYFAAFVLLWVGFAHASAVHAQETQFAEPTEAAKSDATEAAQNQISIEFRGLEGDLLENVKRNVRLVARIDDNVVISDGERRRLQRKALDEIKQALQPFGYYRTTITPVSLFKECTSC